MPSASAPGDRGRHVCCLFVGPDAQVPQRCDVLRIEFSSDHVACGVVADVLGGRFSVGGLELVAVSIVQHCCTVQDVIGPEMKPRALKAVKLAPRWAGAPKPFGSAYTCALTDTVTEVLARGLDSDCWLLAPGL